MWGSERERERDNGHQLRSDNSQRGIIDYNL